MSERQRMPAAPGITRAQPSGRAVLRRTCACGSAATAVSESCPECELKKLQAKLIVGGRQDAEEREADRVASAVMREGAAGAIGAGAALAQRAPDAGASTRGAEAPAIVDRVLAGPGQALDPVARGFFEQRFSRGFGDVRVHADAQAAASARAVEAQAYTVGNHVVFGSARYAPNTPTGRHLLAHELTHVVQQGASLRRASDSAPIDDGSREDDEVEAPLQRLRRTPAIVGLDESGPKADLTGKTEDQMWRLSERDKELAACKKAAGPDPVVCDAPAVSDWSKFTGTPTNKHSAWTVSTIGSVDVPSQQCETKIMGIPSGPVKRFRGLFMPGESWVQPAFRDAADSTKNGSATHVKRCQDAFAKLKPGESFTKPWALPTTPSATCPAAIAPRGDGVTSAADCEAVITKDVTDRAVAESARLLNHEQQHFALTCAIAGKGNELLDAGTSFATVDAAIHKKRRAAEVKYDAETDHGCKPSEQSTWETAIAAGLPDIKLIGT